MDSEQDQSRQKLFPGCDDPSQEITPSPEKDWRVIPLIVAGKVQLRSEYRTPKIWVPDYSAYGIQILHASEYPFGILMPFKFQSGIGYSNRH